MTNETPGSERSVVATVSAAALVSAGLAPAAHGVTAEGACCMSDDSCEELLDFECEASDGVFVGFETSCEAVDCSSGTMAPVLSGAALLLVASLLAVTGVYALRRRFSA